MVADIQLLQGKVVEDPENARVKLNMAKLIEELALEILSDEDLAQAATVSRGTA